MQLYEFTVEVQDGQNEYTLNQYVAAETSELAARYARTWAGLFRPAASYDPSQDTFIALEGSPTWRIAGIHPVSLLVVPHATGHGPITFAVQFLRRDSAVLAETCSPR